MNTLLSPPVRFSWSARGVPVTPPASTVWATSCPVGTVAMTGICLSNCLGGAGLSCVRPDRTRGDECKPGKHWYLTMALHMDPDHAGRECARLCVSGTGLPGGARQIRGKGPQATVRSPEVFGPHLGLGTVLLSRVPIGVG